MSYEKNYNHFRLDRDDSLTDKFLIAFCVLLVIFITAGGGWEHIATNIREDGQPTTGGNQNQEAQKYGLSDTRDTEGVRGADTRDQGGYGEYLAESKKEWFQGIEVTLTTYQAKVEQTDSQPCIGAIGVDICKHKGDTPIALSQDLIWGTQGKYCKYNCPFSYFDRVLVLSEREECNFTGVVLDTMNDRWTMRGDIFTTHNTKCTAKLFKI